MSQTTKSATWRKAIPESRDRLQSRVLVWIAVPLLLYLTVCAVKRWMALFGFLSRFNASQGRYDETLITVPAISAAFALAAWRLRAATPLAAFCGGMICLLITGFTQGVFGSSVFHSGLSPLILLFALTFESTRLGSARKIAAGIAEERKGRNAAQIIANLGVAGFFSTLQSGYIANLFSGGIGTYTGDHDRWYIGLFYLPTLAALVEATADTVSSEIGQAFGGRPILVTTLRRVAPGTDGAISLLGTLAGIAAAALIATTGAPAMGMSFAECAVAFLAGVAGLFLDTLLGATLERRGWIGNDLVNFFSTASAAGVSLVAIRFFQETLLR